jgi:hypothetical protein
MLRNGTHGLGPQKIIWNELNNGKWTSNLKLGMWGYFVGRVQWKQTQDKRQSYSSVRHRSHRPRGLRRRSAAARLRGLRIRIPTGAWMFVFCMLQLGQKAKPGQSGQSSTKYKDRTQKKSHRGYGRLSVESVVCCHIRVSCDGPIPRPEESHQLWRVTACDLETSRMRLPWSALGCCARQGEKR